MTTTTIINQPEGIVELKTNPGCAPIVFLNGVLQQPADYTISNSSVYFNHSGNPFNWSKWFAWRPVKVNGHWVWLKRVYRRERVKSYVNYDDWTQYEYGTIFDVLTD